MKKLLLSVLAAFALSATLSAQNFNIQYRSKLSYPGQTLANICGYWANGYEYALVGASKGLVIVDITNPDAPVNVVQIPGPDNLWKEIKTYGHYAYVTSEGGGGVQIVDLSNLPNANLNYHNYLGDGAIDGDLNTIHALHIDTQKGFLYAYGSNLFGGGAVVLDLNNDPYNPTYVGKFDQLSYIHDGYAANDTLYGGHIYSGYLSIVDMSDKQNPVLLGSTQTPGKFTHNSWLLDDHKHILTTDETTPSFLASYDISDPNDIREIDRFSNNDGYGSYVHNTHVLNDWAVTSWYTDGFNIVDAHRPDNLVITGNYDTWNGGGAQFEGCWGVYPFFPSGTVIASNIEPGELFILTPTYIRACYLEGIVNNACTGEPLGNVQISVNSNAPQVNTQTKSDGSFKTGQWINGTFTVTISKTGFISQTTDVTFTSGGLNEIFTSLEPANAGTINGTVLDAQTQQPIANAAVLIAGDNGNYQTNTDANGAFTVDCANAGDYQFYAGGWGYIPSSPIAVTAGGNYTIQLQRGYYDDFGISNGWNTSSTALAGAWIRAIPVGTSSQGQTCNPGTDADSDDNGYAFVSANANGSASADDVDNGSVTLTCPNMQLGTFDDGKLSFWYWFFNGGGNGNPNDTLVVKANNGSQSVTVFKQPVSASFWRFSGEINLKDYLPLTDNMTISFIASDQPGSGHLVEAGVDVFKVIPTGTTGTGNTIFDPAASLDIWPNPATAGFNLDYNWPGAKQLSVEVSNLLGQNISKLDLPGDSGTFRLPALSQKGIYWVRLISDSGSSRVVKAVQE